MADHFENRSKINSFVRFEVRFYVLRNVSFSKVSFSNFHQKRGV